MLRHLWQACLAALVWTAVLAYTGVPTVLAVLIPLDIAIAGLGLLRWRSLPT
jgi:hypothetical protein